MIRGMTDDITPILLGPRCRLLAMTGAGASAESGLAVFRGAGGLWAGSLVDDVATPAGFRADPARSWAFYRGRRDEASAAAPNAAHLALAAAESRLGDRMLLVTQNIDGLHLRAGSSRVLEIHGSLARARCSSCARPPFSLEDEAPRAAVPACVLCGGMLRPDVLWFGEALDPAHIDAIRRFIRDARRERQHLDYLAVGTSGVVFPASAMVDWARDAGGSCVLVNLHEAENDDRFHRVIRGRAGDVLSGALRVV
jgi:NAD-dependent deacetylase